MKFVCRWFADCVVGGVLVSYWGRVGIVLGVMGFAMGGMKSLLAAQFAALCVDVIGVVSRPGFFMN